jgi:hypothetical protein
VLAPSLRAAQDLLERVDAFTRSTHSITRHAVEVRLRAHVVRVGREVRRRHEQLRRRLRHAAVVLELALAHVREREQRVEHEPVRAEHLVDEDDVRRGRVPRDLALELAPSPRMKRG